MKSLVTDHESIGVDFHDMLPEELAHLRVRSETNKDRERVAEIVFGRIVKE